MKRLGLLIGVLAVLAGAGPVAAQSTDAPPQAGPVLIRPEVAAHWVGKDNGIVWPPANGFDAMPIPMILPAGMLLDRFGPPTGRFLSPRGADYHARALPFACSSQPYTTYRVRVALLVWVGHAAPWFGESGGATQVQTDAPVSLLIADKVLEPVPDLPPAKCPDK